MAIWTMESLKFQGPLKTGSQTKRAGAVLYSCAGCALCNSRWCNRILIYVTGTLGVVQCTTYTAVWDDLEISSDNSVCLSITYLYILPPSELRKRDVLGGKWPLNLYTFFLMKENSANKTKQNKPVFPWLPSVTTVRVSFLPSPLPSTH